MPKALQLQPTRPLTQTERLARKEFLKSDMATLERQMRDIQDQITRLNDGCEHTDGSGRTAVIGGRTKVCSQCGRIVAKHSEKLWG